MTIRRQIFLIALVFLLASPVVLSAGLRVWSEDDYPAEYYSKEISARVVDAETGEPIEGAVVVAQWILTSVVSPPLEGTDRLEVIETVTDSDGRFNIPALGPKKRPRYTFLEKSDPRLSVFKVGYKAESLWNISKAYLEKYYKKGVRTFASYEEMQKYNTQQDPGWPNTYKPKLKVYTLEEIDSALLNDLIRGRGSEEAIPKGSVRESIWDGRTIELHRPKDEDEYWRFVGKFQSEINWSNLYGGRDWKKIRNAALEVEEARKTKPKNVYLSTLPEDAKAIVYGDDKP